jgi:hypothetical protein
MILYLPWKAKVVISIIVVMLLFPSSSQSQSRTSDRITFSCSNIDIREFTRQVTDITGLNFIYSTNRIDTRVRISVSVQNIPLDELFQLVGKQAQLDFVKQGRYVVIKNAKGHDTVTQPVRPPKESVTMDLSEAVPAVVEEFPAVTHDPERNYRNFSAVDADQLVQKYFSYFSTTPNFPVVDYIPRSALLNFKTNQPRSRWFASIGPVVNDYSAGIELQAGLGSMFAVLQNTWLSNMKPRQAFGLGTTFPVMGNFSFTPSYTFSSMQYSETQAVPAPAGMAVNRDVDVSVRHHQMRFMLEYSSGKFGLRAGLLLNHLTTSYSNTGQVVYAYQGGTALQPFNPQLPVQQPGPSKQVVQTRGIAISTLPPYPVQDIWMSWEAGLFYRLNFSRKP